MSHGPTVPGPGDPAPDFALTDTHGTPVRLADLRGAPVVVVFLPFAFSATCTGEVGELRDTIAEFDAAGARVLGISCDPMVTLRAWREAQRLPFELLSDFWPHGAAATAYGVFDAEHGHSRRGSFLLDGAGVVRWSVVSPAGRARELAGYRAALAAL